MSSIARLNLILAGIVVLFAALVFIVWPQPEESAYSALASPYCTHRSFDLPLIAKAAYAVDMKTGVTIYNKNADAQLPLASLTKLVTVLTAMDTLAPEDTVHISKGALTPEGGGLSEGEEWRTVDLADYTLIASVNDGAHALALAVAEKKGDDLPAFINRMNAKAKSMGLVETYFLNDTGLDVSSTSAGAYGSARDIATLLRYITAHNLRLVERTAVEEKDFTARTGQSHTALNTSPLIGTLSGAIASKTGFTDLAGGNLAIVYEPIPGRPVAAAVLGSTREGRDADMEALMDSTKQWLTRVILCQHGD